MLNIKQEATAAFERMTNLDADIYCVYFNIGKIRIQRANSLHVAGLKCADKKIIGCYDDGAKLPMIVEDFVAYFEGLKAGDEWLWNLAEPTARKRLACATCHKDRWCYE